MINRREIIASGLAISILPRLDSSSAESLRVPYFVADERFREAREASRSAARSGTSIMTLAIDVTATYESLDRAWRSARFAVSGMTTPNALFALERLAWDHGLRTAYRGIHRFTSEGSVRHELVASSERLRHVGGGRHPWPAHVGRALTWWSSAEATRNEPVLLSQMLPCADGATLVSWLLTPKSSVGRRLSKQA